SLAQEEPNLVVQQITEILDMMQTVGAPYLGSATPWPRDIQDQVVSLFSEANRIAGGDAGAYLRNNLLQLEIEEVATGEFDEPDGEAPPYPVLYLAEVLLPDGVLTLRGQTGPDGQYTLFWPRNGILLSVRFYDP